MDLLVVSLFSGAGGLDLGFQWAGFKTILAIDIDDAAVKTMEVNFPEAEVLKRDLSREKTVQTIIDRIKYNLARVDQDRLIGVIGGPPCQGFSVMNASNNHRHERNRLVFRYASILSQLGNLGLDFFVFENVPILKGHKYGEVYRQALRMFASAGFRVSDDILDALEFGVPQFRKRLFIVGLNEAKYRFTFDFTRLPNRNALERRVAGDVLRGLPRLTASNDYSRRDFHPNHASMKPYSARIAQVEPGDTARKSFKRLAWDRPSPTVAYGHNEVHIHPAKGDQDRRLSAYEAMLLQGFKRSKQEKLRYYLKGTMSDWQRLVSEAVAPPVAYSIAAAIQHQLVQKPTPNMTPPPAPD